MASPGLKCQENRSTEQNIHRTSGSAGSGTESPQADSFLLRVDDVTFLEWYRYIQIENSDTTTSIRTKNEYYILEGFGQSKTNLRYFCNFTMTPRQLKG